MVMTSVLVAAPSTVVRAGLEALINASQSLAVVGSVSDETTLGQQVLDLQPDVVLMEMEQHTDEPMQALLAHSEESHTPALVILTDDAEGSWTLEALQRSAVRGLLPRDALAEEIVGAVEAAAVGLVVLHPTFVDSLLREPASSIRSSSTASTSEVLTPREIEVLAMMAEGLGNKTIAYRLNISEHTVKFHVGSIFARLGAQSRTEAVMLGIRQGLIML